MNYDEEAMLNEIVLQLKRTHNYKAWYLPEGDSLSEILLITTDGKLYQPLYNWNEELSFEHAIGSNWRDDYQECIRIINFLNQNLVNFDDKPFRDDVAQCIIYDKQEEAEKAEEAAEEARLMARERVDYVEGRGYYLGDGVYTEEKWW